MLFSNLSVLGKYEQSTGNNLLICHLIDTAAVSLELWEKTYSESTKRQITKFLGSLFNLDYRDINKKNVKNYLGFLNALHDLGKISPNFQKRVWHSGTLTEGSDIYGFYKELFQNQEKQIGSSVKIHHSAITYHAIQEIPTYKPFKSSLNINKINHKEIGTILSAHHGVYHKNEILLKIRRNKRGQLGNEEWSQIRRDHIKVLIRIFFPSDFSNDQAANIMNLDHKKVPEATWLVGLACIADWIASNVKYFPYNTKVPVQWKDIEEYWEIAQCRAKIVIEKLNWEIKNKRISKDEISFNRVFDKVPRPLQQKIDEIKIEEPECIFIEAPTGEGKTEAAMYLMIKNDMLGLSGVYIALPTQATSNQMFTRVRDFLARYYISVDETFNLMLLHGHATLVEEFEKILEFYPKNIIDDEDNVGATPRASQWFTYRKRGMLSPYGVGTIDQALMSVLQTKHYMVRLNGLTGKTVILDEIHAYDTYMTELIEKMLIWLGALGTSVILLSATLPSLKRAQLIAAYQKGKMLKLDAIQDENLKFNLQAKYPRITWTRGSEVKELEFPPSNVGIKTVKVSWINNEYSKDDSRFLDGSGVKGKLYKMTLRDFFKKKLRDGGCGAVICNRVDEAQEIYHNLRQLEGDNEGFEILLFHSRFRILERKEIEKKTITFFGDNRNFRPEKAIIVATQVIEQSLDIDFDIMVSAIAPVDLILQRIGRLHRHKIKDRIKTLEEPEIIIMIPPLNTECLSVPIPDFKNYSQIYQPHVLLRSWLHLKTISFLKIPEMVEEAIEYVYDDYLDAPDNSDEDLKVYWRKTWERLLKKRKKIRKMAVNQIIRDPDGSVPYYKIGESQLEEDDPVVHKFRRAQTRLIGPSLRVVLLKKGEYSYYKKEIQKKKSAQRDYISKQLKKWLLERTVNITNYLAIQILQNIKVPAEWETDSHLRYSRLVSLDEVSGSHIIEINNSLKLELNQELGLLIKKIK
jgi:CRISPR-associated endonuclease/helicase Cas3